MSSIQQRKVVFTIKLICADFEFYHSRNYLRCDVAGVM